MAFYVALEKSHSILILNPLYYQSSLSRVILKDLFASIVMNF